MELNHALQLKIEGTTNPAVTVSISDVTVTEGTHATADFVVSLNRATSGPVTMDFETSQTTADPANDYFEDDGTLTFQPGETQKTISIAIQDDRLAESNETFDMGLSNLRGANSFTDDTGDRHHRQRRTPGGLDQRRQRGRRRRRDDRLHRQAEPADRPAGDDQRALLVGNGGLRRRRGDR